jgi:hypothetical protein
MGVQFAFDVQTAAAPPAPTTADLDWLKGRTVVHKIVVGVSEPIRSVIAILHELSCAEGEVRALTVKPSAERFEAVLQATALTPEAARRLVGRIAAYLGVSSAAIEHVLIS